MTRPCCPDDGRPFSADPGPVYRELADEVIGLSCCAPSDCGDVGALVWRLDRAHRDRAGAPVSIRDWRDRSAATSGEDKAER